MRWLADPAIARAVTIEDAGDWIEVEVV